MRARYLLVATGVVILAIGVVWLRSQDVDGVEKHTDASVDRSSADIRTIANDQIGLYPPNDGRLVDLARHENDERDQRALRVQVDQLREQLRSLEQQIGSIPEERQPDLTPEQAKRAHEERHQQQIELVRSQPVDPTWAAGTQAGIAAAFQTAAMSVPLNDTSKPTAGEVQSVDCRTDACIVSMQWPSYDAAISGWNAALSVRPPVNCNREILIPDPISATGSHSAQLILTDCDR